MLHLAVCDDEELHLNNTLRALSEDAEKSGFPVTLRGFSNTAALLSAITEDGYAPDIAVLDIKMGEMDGITLGKQINRHLPGCQLIYVTGYVEYASDVYETEHVYFVLKSQLQTRIHSALQKAMKQRSELLNRSIIVTRAGTASMMIPIGEVLYLERVARKTQVVTLQQVHETKAKPEALIPSSDEQCFIRCHQSFWVNHKHIKSMQANDFLLTNDALVPISRTYKQQARKAFFRVIQG